MTFSWYVQKLRKKVLQLERRNGPIMYVVFERTCRSISLARKVLECYGNTQLALRARTQVREISSLYVVGQHTPKHAVYTPNRKPFRKFQDDYVRFWLEKLFRYARTLDNGQKGIELREAEQLFPSLNLTTLKKCMRTIAVAKKKSNFWERKKGMFAMKNVTFSCPHSLFEHSYRYQ